MREPIDATTYRNLLDQRDRMKKQRDDLLSALREAESWLGCYEPARPEIDAAIAKARAAIARATS